MAVRLNVSLAVLPQTQKHLQRLEPWEIHCSSTQITFSFTPADGAAVSSEKYSVSEMLPCDLISNQSFSVMSRIRNKTLVAHCHISQIRCYFICWTLLKCANVTLEMNVLNLLVQSFQNRKTQLKCLIKIKQCFHCEWISSWEDSLSREQWISHRMSHD